MANVHTLSSLSANYGGTSSGARPVQVGFGGIPIGDDGRQQRPRCIDIVFPGFTWYSFVLWISVVQILVYVASLILGSYALTPNLYVRSFTYEQLRCRISLNNLGASKGTAIASGQVWRLVTPLFLHAGFWHILVSIEVHV